MKKLFYIKEENNRISSLTAEDKYNKIYIIRYEREKI